MVLTGRRRRSIPGHQIHKHMNADLTKIMKNDGPGAGNYADADKIQGPQTGP